MEQRVILASQTICYTEGGTRQNTGLLGKRKDTLNVSQKWVRPLMSLTKLDLVLMNMGNTFPVKRSRICSRSKTSYCHTMLVR